MWPCDVSIATEIQFWPVNLNLTVASHDLLPFRHILFFSCTIFLKNMDVCIWLLCSRRATPAVSHSRASNIIKNKIAKKQTKTKPNFQGSGAIYRLPHCIAITKLQRWISSIFKVVRIQRFQTPSQLATSQQVITLMNSVSLELKCSGWSESH